MLSNFSIRFHFISLNPIGSIIIKNTMKSIKRLDLIQQILFSNLNLFRINICDHIQKIKKDVFYFLQKKKK